MGSDKKQVIIGVDVSKAKLDIYDLTVEKHHVIENKPRSIGQWLARIQKQYIQVKIVFEPTGGYEKKLINALLSKDIIAYSIHPNKLLNFKKCEGDKAKTDKIDANYIAQYAKVYPEQLKEITENYVKNKGLSELNTTRKQIKMQLQSVNNYSEHDPYSKEIKQHHKRLKKFLLQELQKIELAIEDAISHDEEKTNKAQILQSMKGVGKVVAQTMVCNVPELGNIENGKISKLIGVAPINQDSGKKQSQRCIEGGRADVRAVLYMAALSAIRYNPKMKQIYTDLRNRGKPFKVAIVAIMRRMVCVMNAMVRDNKPWQDTNELVVQKA